MSVRIGRREESRRRAGTPARPGARRRWIGPSLAGLVAWTGCGDAFEQLLGPVPLQPTRVELVDFRTGPLQTSSAFDVVGRRAVRVDQTSGWDFLFFVTEEGTPELRPFEAVTGTLQESGMQKVDVTFEGLTLAPQDGYVRTEPIPIAEGDVLAVVSRRDPAFGGIRCRRYAKIEVLGIDIAAGSLTFQHLINPNCEVRGLVPGETGSLDE